MDMKLHTLVTDTQDHETPYNELPGTLVYSVVGVVE